MGSFPWWKIDILINLRTASSIIKFAEESSLQLQSIVIDASGHLLGRLASTIAKSLLTGQRIIVVRCEQVNISGSFYRNKLKYLDFLRKRTNTKPSRGPFHFRAPSRIVWRTVRGKYFIFLVGVIFAVWLITVLKSLKNAVDPLIYFSIFSYGSLLYIICFPLQYCVLGRLSHEVGWKYKDVLETLEEKRKAKAAVYYEHKKKLQKLKQKAEQDKADELESVNEVLESYGY
ncbi:60S ribosomal protein L13a-like [Orbicella faveolata]|uniref:60S ribosomal protein L13a-like n=1 Tax=Orbicella faveolata TaxID=48498 RepID=UPI0009E44856|nr:60S ribosomal protein L13a-like [Orbicella faveolata]